MTAPAVLWLLFGSWFFHDLEEVLLFKRFRPDNIPPEKDPTVTSRIVNYVTSNVAHSQAEFNIAVIIMGIVVLTATLAGYLDPGGFGMLVYGAMLGGYFLHVFTHIGGSVILRRYTPGVITAFVIALPASVLIYMNIFELQLLTWWQAVWTALIGIAIFVPLLLLIFQASKAIAAVFGRH